MFHNCLIGAIAIRLKKGGKLCMVWKDTLPHFYVRFKGSPDKSWYKVGYVLHYSNKEDGTWRVEKIPLDRWERWERGNVPVVQ